MGDEYPLRLGVRPSKCLRSLTMGSHPGQRVTASSSAIAASLDLARYS